MSKYRVHSLTLFRIGIWLHRGGGGWVCLLCLRQGGATEAQRGETREDAARVLR